MCIIFNKYVWNEKGNFVGKHLNPGNDGFKEVLNSHYVDKTGLIAVVNDTIGTTKKLTCISRPRSCPEPGAQDSQASLDYEGKKLCLRENIYYLFYYASV